MTDETSQTIVYEHKQDRPDSIEIGTPGKGGTLKFYFNAARPEETEELLKHAHEALAKARKLMEGVEPCSPSS